MSTRIKRLSLKWGIIRQNLKMRTSGRTLRFPSRSFDPFSLPQVSQQPLELRRLNHDPMGCMPELLHLVRGQLERGGQPFEIHTFIFVLEGIKLNFNHIELDISTRSSHGKSLLILSENFKNYWLRLKWSITIETRARRKESAGVICQGNDLFPFAVFSLPGVRPLFHEFQSFNTKVLTVCYSPTWVRHQQIPLEQPKRNEEQVHSNIQRKGLKQDFWLLL